MSRLRRTSIALVSLALAGAISSPAMSSASSTHAASPVAQGGTQAFPPGGRVLGIEWEQEEKEWWCGPAAARMALKSWVSKPMSQAGLADLMVFWDPPKPWNWATPNVGAAMWGMNVALANSGLPPHYASSMFDDDADVAEKAAELRTDTRNSIGRFGHAMVVNIASTTDNKLHPAYPDRTVLHYITVYGYDHEGDTLYVADPASGLNDDYADVPQKYKVSTEHLAEIMHDGNDSDLYYTHDLFGGTDRASAGQQVSR